MAFVIGVLTRAFIFVICCHVTSALFNAVFNLSENKGQDYFIGNIATESGVLATVNETDKPNIRFSFLKEDAEFGAYFDINDKTGALNTSSVLIDREKVCEFSVDCDMKFEIAAKYNQFFSIVYVTVNILDENDNEPAFPKSVVNLNISESEATGTTFRMDSAYDADMWGNNSIQGYSIDQATEIFELIEPNKGDRFFVLKLNNALDREEKDTYTVKIIASDGGDPMRQGILTINVKVLDENDNGPVFSSNQYNITIDENIVPGTVILTLSANDKDFGQNAEILYKINERQINIETVRRIFALNETSGDLSVIKNLLLESTESYEFIVDAADNSASPQTNTTVVMVTVNDVLNKPPTIKVNLISPGKIGFVDIDENLTNGSFVAHVEVDDNDKGQNGDFSCNITNAYFRLEAYLGFKVVVNGALDRETQDTHNVTVTCMDKGSPSMTSSESFLVRISDQNDNTPVFDKDIYNVTKAENNSLMDSITSVSAKDADIGANGLIEYVLHDDNEGRFLINNNTGDIFANKTFDMETEPLTVIRVLAIDHGPTRRTATATVSLTLTDINDNAPVIIPARPEFTVMENLKNGTSVGILYATDADSGENGKFTFAIAPVSKSFPFTLHPNGEFTTKRPLDREIQSRYEIPVMVTDMGSEPRSNIHYVTIYVADENDNTPKVTFPNSINDSVKFLYPVELYNVVTTVAAYDVDLGENSTLSFSIVNGNEMGIFEIDSKLGELSVKKFIDIKQDLVVTLMIEVKDNGIVSKSTVVSLIVELLYANATTTRLADAGNGNKYIIISVVVVITTVVFAAAIVGIILFIRSLDRSKRYSEHGSAAYTDSGISSRSDSQSLPPDMDVLGSDNGRSKKKKEVSFSLEYSLGGFDGGRNVESTTEDNSKQNQYNDCPPPPPVQHYGPVYSLQKQEKIDSHMKALKLQQYLWEAKSRDWDSTNIEVQHPALGDSESETSRETNTCDSGRGGSEDDVSTSSPTTDDRRSFNFSDSRGSTKHVSFQPHQQFNTHSPRDYLPTVRENTPVHHGPAPPRPPSYRHSINEYPTDLNTHNTKIALKNFPQTYLSQDEMFNHRPPVHSSDPWREYMQHNRMRHDSCSSMRSNEDDGGSTTTSGSYTLDPDEIDMGMYSNQGDLFV